MENEVEDISCERFHEQIKDKKRIAVAFVGKQHPATEGFLKAIGEPYGEGYFGAMEVAVIPVDNEACDTLAEHEGVETLPKVCVYAYDKRVGCVEPDDADAKMGYRQTIEKLIDLSED